MGFKSRKKVLPHEGSEHSPVDPAVIAQREEVEREESDPAFIKLGQEIDKELRALFASFHFEPSKRLGDRKILVIEPGYDSLVRACIWLKRRIAWLNEWPDSMIEPVMSGTRRPRRQEDWQEAPYAEVERYLFELSEHLAKLDTGALDYNKTVKVLRDSYVKMIDLYVPPKPDPFLELESLLWRAGWGISKYEARQLAGAISVKLFEDPAEKTFQGSESELASLVTQRKARAKAAKQSAPTRIKHGVMQIRVPPKRSS